jgi:hypothetical protein
VVGGRAKLSQTRGPDLPWRVLAWASLAVAALVAKAEADTVIAGVTPSGQYTTSTVFGTGQLAKPQALPTATLNAWSQASTHFGDLWLWLLVQAGFSLVMLAGGLMLCRTVITAAGLGGGPGWGALRRWWPLAGVAAATVIQVVLSALTSIFWIRPHHDVPAVLAGFLAAAVVVKWLLAVVFAAQAAVQGHQLWGTPAFRAKLTQAGWALKKQRFSIVIVALLMIIAVARGSDVLEQLPDVQRAWLTWPPSLGWAHLGFAVGAQLLLAGLLARLGALRVQRARDTRTAGDDRDAPGYLPWAATALGLPAIALILRYTDLATVSWYNLLPIPVVAALVVAGSLVTWLFTRHAETAEPPPAAPPAARGPESDQAVAVTGDVLAVAVIAVTGLGLVRSFTAAALVVSGYRAASAIAVAAGFGVAALSWVAVRGFLQGRAEGFDEKYHTTGWDRQRTGPALRRAPSEAADQPGRRSPAIVLAIFAIPFAVADVLLVFLPLWTVHWLGVLATTVIALGTLAVGLAVLAYLAQSRKPLPVFARLLRLKSTPVITLTAVVALLAAVIGASAPLHDIRMPPAVAAAAGGTAHGTAAAAAASAVRPTLLSRLQAWLANPLTASCAIPASADGSVRVEPLVLVAAAGGGIRAAWWTVKAMDTMTASACGAHAVFAASGVSGGSVGLAIVATTPAARRNAVLARVAGPDGLAAAMDGLLLRDTLAGLTGVDVTAASMRPASQRFPDRAALLEHEWESEAPGLARPFPLAGQDPSWQLLLNSTAVSTGCRAILSGSALAAAPVTAPAPTQAAAASTAAPGCDLHSAAPMPDSYDFFAALPCLRGIDTVTAALLSARFPYVTPSGVVDGCGPDASKHQAEQYVDGGYADSSGLATLAGLAPGMMTAIRQYNATAVAGTGPVTLVVPVTVYLGNSPQPEPFVGTPAGSPPQPLIPLQSGAASAKDQLTGVTALMQQLAATTGNHQWLPCTSPSPAAGAGQAPGTGQACASDQQAASQAVPQQLILVVPREYPSVATPLGWVLSAASRSTLNSGLATEAASTCPAPQQNIPYCPAGVGRLGDLMKLLNH